MKTFLFLIVVCIFVVSGCAQEEPWRTSQRDCAKSVSIQGDIPLHNDFVFGASNHACNDFVKDGGFERRDVVELMASATIQVRFHQNKNQCINSEVNTCVEVYTLSSGASAFYIWIYDEGFETNYGRLYHEFLHVLLHLVDYENHHSFLESKDLCSNPLSLFEKQCGT